LKHAPFKRPQFSNVGAYRPVPDFMLVVQVADMPAYLAFTQRLLTQDANVRNVKAFFSVKRAKFGTQITLPNP
jgi:Lrp/AsnC family transcriptional regulator, leucine-responsive regulatory protein